MAPLTFCLRQGHAPESAPRSVPGVTHGRGGVEFGRERCDGLLTTANQESGLLTVGRYGRQPQSVRELVFRCVAPPLRTTPASNTSPPLAV